MLVFDSPKPQKPRLSCGLCCCLITIMLPCHNPLLLCAVPNEIMLQDDHMQRWYIKKPSVLRWYWRQRWHERPTFARSPVLDEDRMRSGHWLGSVLSVSLSALTLMPGWQAGHVACKKTRATYPQTFSSKLQNSWRKITDRELESPGKRRRWSPL